MLKHLFFCGKKYNNEIRCNSTIVFMSTGIVPAEFLLILFRWSAPLRVRQCIT